MMSLPLLMSPPGQESYGTNARWPAGLEKNAETALAEFLLKQRWYPGKDAGRPKVALERLLPFPTCHIRSALAVWTITPPQHSPLRLFVPLALVPLEKADPAGIIDRVRLEDGTPAVLVEAFTTDEFVREWVGALFRSEAGPVAPGLSAFCTSDFPAARAEDVESFTLHRSKVEQSNTSIKIGDDAILKVIRKLEEGVHPELEVSRFLSERAEFAATPKLLGWLELEGATGGGTSTLSILQAFVQNEGDGWSWLLDRLARIAEPRAEIALQEATAWLRTLARRTAEMHRAFANEREDPAFRAEPAGEEDLRRWQDAVRATAARAFQELAARREQLAPEARRLAERVMAQRDTVLGRIDELVGGDTRFVKSRHHGDFHLGQVLVADRAAYRDAIIIDFEGEPMRPLAERRMKHAVLRDVAGMMRSLSYAVVTASSRLPDTAEGQARSAAETELSAWGKELSQAFFEAYLNASEGSPALPRDRAEVERLVRFFMLEKCLYEVSYELANRPDWVAIPLKGVLDLIETSTAAVAYVHRMPFGAELQSDGRVRFRLWAPAHAAIQITIEGQPEPLPMQPLDCGWHELVTDRAGAGTRYRFVLPDGASVPDPASRHQPEDVHGPSEVIDPAAYRWRDVEWCGRPWTEAVVYELHIGAFTPEGTFSAAIDRLDHLVELGVTAIEIMPIGDFPGRRNWGYDGVLPYAPDSSYGRPEDLKALVEAVHERGLMVLLDVVYNHFGPEGAYLHSIAPEFFTDRHRTPWGAAINMDGEDAAPVRAYFIHNALYWIEEFHLDGLRLDAVHAILDNGTKHLLQELAERVRAAFPDRHVHLILENEENEASRLARDEAGRPLWYTAQWNDDVHHVLHVAATGERAGYYADYLARTDLLGRALAEGFAFQGEVMPYRSSERGEPSAALPPAAFVAFAQNHDQVGNRAFGDRLNAIAMPEAVRAVAAIYLLLPQIPMLFMGEEWGAAQPFPFFCDFGPELAAAVRRGRREEFARFPEFQNPAVRETIPDPTAEATFLSAKLAWADREREPHAELLGHYRRLLDIRRREIAPRLAAINSGGTWQVLGEGAVTVRWALSDGGALVLAANLSAEKREGFPPRCDRVIWREGDTGEEGIFGPFAVRWSVEG